MSSCQEQDYTKRMKNVKMQYKIQEWNPAINSYDL